MTSKRIKKPPSKLPALLNTLNKLPKSIQIKNKEKILSGILADENKKNNVTLAKKKNVNKKVVTKEVSDSRLATDNEYYPKKLKRNMSGKKIILKPKYDMKVVACTNKRKLSVPRKGCSIEGDLEPCHSPSDTEMSMYDAVRLADESHSLSDEDLMEILTCPSPVWWEEPPDPNYTEDPIYRMPTTQTKTIQKTTDLESIDYMKVTTEAFTQKKQNTIDSESIDNIKVTTETYTQKKQKTTDLESIDNMKVPTEAFTQKKQKLEDLLGSIKKKKEVAEEPRILCESSDGDNFSDISMSEEEILRGLENIDIPIGESEGSRKITENSGNHNGGPNGTILECLIQQNLPMEAFRNGCINDFSGVEQDIIVKVPSLNRRRKPRKSPVGVKPHDDSTLKLSMAERKNIKKRQRSVGFKKLEIHKSVLKNINDQISSLNHPNNKLNNQHKDSIDNQNVVNSVNNDSEDSNDLKSNNKQTGFIKVRNDLIQNDVKQIVPEKLTTLKRTPVIKENSIQKSSVFKSNCNIQSDSVVPDEDYCIDNFNLVDSDTVDTGIKKNKGTDECFENKLLNNLSEYITVYKIMPNDKNGAKTNNNVTGKLNTFLKKMQK